jgi:ribonuclease P protein component
VEFDRVYRHGRSASSRYLVLYAFPRGDAPAEVGEGDSAEKTEEPRLGVSVGRRVGGAVVRNRVKRVLREAFWSLAESVPPDHDYVIVARSDARGLDEREGASGVERELAELVRQLGLKAEGNGDEATG